MALITFTGYPCSGKSRRINEELVPAFQCRIDDPSYTGPIKRIVVLSDDALNIPRSVYAGGSSFASRVRLRLIEGSGD